MIIDDLFNLADKEYAIFQAKLTPTIPIEDFIGVRVPVLRKYAKKLYKEGNYQDFLDNLPHKYYDENLLHGLLVAEIKDFDICMKELEKFLPYIDNWAVCDTLKPKIFSKHKDELLNKINTWVTSNHAYTIRFAIEMIMNFFLDDDFKKEYLEIPASVHSDEYYVNMMIAWFYATALAKQWKDTIPYIENNVLDTFAHNKTIQKARESYRITNEQKEYLNKLKR